MLKTKFYIVLFIVTVFYQSVQGQKNDTFEQSISIYKFGNYLLNSKIIPDFMKSNVTNKLSIDPLKINYTSNSLLSLRSYYNDLIFIRTYLNQDSVFSNSGYSILQYKSELRFKENDIFVFDAFLFQYHLQNPQFMDISTQMGFDVDADGRADVIGISSGSTFLMRDPGAVVEFSQAAAQEKERNYLIKRELGMSAEDSTWRYEAVSSEMTLNMEDDGLKIDLSFDGDAVEDEFGIIQRRFDSIDLKQFPYYSLNYDIADPDVQQILVYFNLDFNQNGRPDGLIRSGLSPPDADHLDCNVLELAEQTFPGKDHYDVVETVIHLKKINGVDVKDRTGNYAFKLKNMMFYNEVPFILEDTAYFSPDSTIEHIVLPTRIEERSGMNTMTVDFKDQLEKKYPEAEDIDLLFLNIIHHMKKDAPENIRQQYSYLYLRDPAFVQTVEEEVPSIYVLNGTDVTRTAPIYGFSQDFRNAGYDFSEYIEATALAAALPADSTLFTCAAFGVPDQYVFVTSRGGLKSEIAAELKDKLLFLIHEDEVEALFRKQGVSIETRNVAADYIMSVGEIRIFQNFDGRSREEEGVVLTKELPSVNLLNYPVFSARYFIEDANIQDVELHLTIGFEKEGGGEETVTVFPVSVENAYTDFRMDLLSYLQQRFPMEKEFFLTKIQLLFSKSRNVDIPRLLNTIRSDDTRFQNSRGLPYEFRLQNITLSRTQNRLENIADLFTIDTDMSRLDGRDNVVNPSGFRIRKENVFYKTELTDKGLECELFFDERDGQASELTLAMRQNIDLDEYPIFSAMYTLEDSIMQIVDGKFSIIDGRRRRYELDIPLQSQGEYNLKDELLEKTWSTQPDTSNLRLTGIDLILKKQSFFHEETTPKTCSFILQSMHVYRKSETLMEYLKNVSIPVGSKSLGWNFAETNTRISGTDPDFTGIQYIDSTLQIDNILFEGIDKISSQVTLKSEKFEPVNIRDFPLLEFDYSIDDERCQDIQFNVMISSSSGDEDIIPINPKLSGNKPFMVNILKEAEELFPGVDNIFVDSLIIDLQAKKLLRSDIFSDYRFAIKPVRFFNPVESKTKLFDVLHSQPVLSLDGQEYCLDETMIQDAFKEDGAWCTLDTVFLEEGSHVLNVPDNKYIDVRLVELKSFDPLAAADTVYTEEPVVEFQKINPTRYKVNVTSDTPFWLVFSESFHQKWKAYVLEDTTGSIGDRKSEWEWSALMTYLEQKDIRHELELHEMVNGYANGWYVPVDSLMLKGIIRQPDMPDKPEFTVILEFTPQRLFEIGVLISGTTFITLISILVFLFIRKLTSKKVS